MESTQEEEGFTKRRCSGGLVGEGVWSVIIRCSVSFIIVLGGGVIIIVIADRAVRGPEQTGLLADCQPDFSLCSRASHCSYSRNLHFPHCEDLYTTSSWW